MSRLIKIVDNKYVQIEEYRNPNICFNTNEYNDFEDYCTLREIFNPFEMFYENQELKKQVENYKKLDFKYLLDKNNNLETQQKEFIKYMNSCIKELEKESPNKLQNTINLAIKDIAKIILQKYKEIIGDDK